MKQHAQEIIVAVEGKPTLDCERLGRAYTAGFLTEAQAEALEVQYLRQGGRPVVSHPQGGK